VLSSANGNKYKVLGGHKKRIKRVLELDDGRLLSWSDDGTLRLWFESGEPLATLYFDAAINEVVRIAGTQRFLVVDSLYDAHLVDIN